MQESPPPRPAKEPGAGGPPRARPRGAARNAILACVNSASGINKTGIVARSGYAWGTVSYHVEALRRLGKIKALRDARDLLLFPLEFPEARLHLANVLRKPGAGAVLALLRARREATIPDVMGGTGLSRRIATKRLHELVEARVAERRGKGRPRFAACAAPGRSQAPDPSVIGCHSLRAVPAGGFSLGTGSWASRVGPAG